MKHIKKKMQMKNETKKKQQKKKKSNRRPEMTETFSTYGNRSETCRFQEQFDTSST